MPYPHTLGKIPHKRHTQFRKPDGSLYAEELFSTEGFSNDYSLLYHVHPPTQIIRTAKLQNPTYQEQWLQEGDQVELEIDGLGTLTNTIVREQTDWSILNRKKGWGA